MTESQVSGKTQARHAIELIADYYESHDEWARAGVARRSMDSELLDVILGVLRDLTQTTNAYVNANGNDEQKKEIARLTRELKTAKGLQTDNLARVNERLIAVQLRLDALLAAAPQPPKETP